MLSQFQALSALIAFTAIAEGATVPLDLRDTPGVGWIRGDCTPDENNFCLAYAQTLKTSVHGCQLLSTSPTSRDGIYPVCLEARQVSCPNVPGSNKVTYGFSASPNYLDVTIGCYT
ncbi:hypothetical protein PTMSG1_03058 [Pyrenophora teres f. maculata]|nr:hypothetical protein PTMSG1_03058 [Pyrenophora teres f. maculata]